MGSQRNSPLFNHLILENMLENLELADLKTFRLVCTNWHEVSLSYVINEAKIYLEGSSLEHFLYLLTRNDVQNSRIPLAKFKNYTIKINSTLSISTDIPLMWTYIHNNIKYLTLHITTLYVKNQMETLLIRNLPSAVKIKIVVMKYWGSVDCNTLQITNADNAQEIQSNKNLTSFQLAFLRSDLVYGYANASEYDEFIFPVPWVSFFVRFPELNHLSLIGFRAIDITCMMMELQELHVSEENPGLKSLEILYESQFPEAPNRDHFVQLTHLPQGFTSLHLEVSPIITSDTLNQLFMRHRSTLKTLKLRRFPQPFIAMVSPITFTVEMQNVTFLEMSIIFTMSMSFLPHFPSLKTLHIILRDYSHLPSCQMVQNTPNPARLVHSGVKNLYIEPPLMSNTCIQILSVCFPNLRKVHLRVNDEMFREICAQAQNAWKNLASLHIVSWDGLTDEGITGINQDVLKSWGSYSTFEAGNNRAHPYLGNMTNLKNLAIEMWSDYYNHISDWSVYYGILDLKNLENVSLIRSDISDSAFQRIPAKNKEMVQ